MSDLHTVDDDYNLGERFHIVGTCPHCRLPIYVHDGRDLVKLPTQEKATLYHAGCAYRAQVRYWQDQARESVEHLRVLQCRVIFEIQVPVS